MNTLSKKPTSLSLDKSVLKDARALEAYLSQAAEAGIKRAAINANYEQWKNENSDAIASSNEWVDANGLPLKRYRQF